VAAVETRRRRRAALIQLGVGADLARQAASSGLGPWRLSRCTALHAGFPTILPVRGFPSLAGPARATDSNRRVRTVRTVVWQGSR